MGGFAGPCFSMGQAYQRSGFSGVRIQDSGFKVGSGVSVL